MNLYSKLPQLLGVTQNHLLVPLCRPCVNQSPSCSTNEWNSVIGLEIHAQLATRSKLFSGGSTCARQPVNSAVTHFDIAMPGTLPVLNRKCVEFAVRAALALNCKLNMESFFDRKHYFYFDMPAGYQITQNRKPIAHDGHLDYYVDYGMQKTSIPYRKRTRIIQIQLEQDSGKTIHDAERDRTLVDLNRAGVGLIEVVSEPNLTTPSEAYCFANALRDLLSYIGVCEGRLQSGHFRVDANVSVNRPGTPLGNRTEVKNLNDFLHIRNAIVVEVGRQVKLRSSGEPVVSETRYYNPMKKETYSLRDKEVFHDYRHLPEPNLPPLVLYSDLRPPPAHLSDDQIINVDRIDEQLCRPLPIESMDSWIATGADCTYAVNAYLNPEARGFVQRTVDHSKFEFLPQILRLMFQEYRGVLEKLGARSLDFSEKYLSPVQFSSVVNLFATGQITSQAAKVVMSTLIQDASKTSLQIISSHKFIKITDQVKIKQLIGDSLNDSLIKEYMRRRNNPKKILKVIDYIVDKVGKTINYSVEADTIRSLLPSIIEK